jgi:hypothetical protein
MWQADPAAWVAFGGLSNGKDSSEAEVRPQLSAISVAAEVEK